MQKKSIRVRLKKNRVRIQGTGSYQSVSRSPIQLVCGRRMYVCISPARIPIFSLFHPLMKLLNGIFKTSQQARKVETHQRCKYERYNAVYQIVLRNNTGMIHIDIEQGECMPRAVIKLLK